MFKKSFNTSLEIAFIVTIAINIIFYVFTGEIAELFAYSSANAGLAVMIADSLRTVGLYIVIVPFGLIASSYFQSIGKGTYSLFISIMRELVLIILSIIIFAVVLGWGATGVYVGLVIGALIGSTFAYLLGKYHLNKPLELVQILKKIN
ncbi:MAG: hypothetical protein MJ209_06990 [archaeon]|nr:hypothetical protein [archaeon]